MSVFLALIFQVLFVFFAMVINIGLLVHDKINLQNSVDLGSYYAAQKQAEILNEIAHLNYQIRQDYKLLAWRYWVLGTLGRNAQERSLPPATSPVAAGDVPRLYNEAGPGGAEEVPIACIANPYWSEFASLLGPLPDANYCWHAYGGNPTGAIATPSPPFTPATGFANSLAAMYAAVGTRRFVEACENASPLSWAFVANIITDYKFAISYKKKAIKKLRENLVSANPVDREGKSLRDGVIMTIEKNLTESNAASFNPAQVQIMNGLSRGGCDGGARPGERVLPEILTQPGLYFALLTATGAGACQFRTAFQTQYSSVSGGEAAVVPWDSFGVLRSMVQSEPASLDDQYHSSLGFEKNPWCMAYVGVKASTKPRKPFAPFGQAVNLVARSFAQPFGGRIGPWYSKTWSKASPISDSIAQPVPVGAAFPIQLNPQPSQAGRTDPLTSPRLSPANGTFTYSSLSLPNFSRFPGDQLGLRSSLNQSLARKYFLTINTRIPWAAGNYIDNRVHLSWFYNFATMNTTGDALAFDEQVAGAGGPSPPSLLAYRQVESAAVAPDLFDVTYYSIDPEADKNYAAIARANPGHYGIAGAPMGDLGSRETDALMRAYNIQNQITSANGVGIDQTLMPGVYWLIRKWENLLTAWAPHRATNFSFPIDRFGQCQGSALPTAMIPGKCAVGGRTGYSVRLISREHLQGKWDVGANGTADTLLNPPPNDTDF